ncbi:MAG: alginate export family protein [Bacteroidota bacterium]
MRTLVTSILLLLIMVAPSTAQVLQWSGEVRIRSEADSRNFDLDSSPNTYTLMRTRLGLGVGLHPDVRLFVQLQDSRQFGEAGNTLAPIENIDLHQAFVEARRVIGDAVGFRAGRMALAYGNERIIGAVGWHNVGRAFDGLVVNIGGEPLSLDLIATNIRETQPWAPVATPQATRPQPDDQLLFYGAYLQSALSEVHFADAYLLWESDRAEYPGRTRRMSRATLGTYLRGSLSPELLYKTEVALQTGRRMDDDVFAYMLTGSLSYRFGAPPPLTATLGYDHLSGSPTDDDRYGAFDPLFHTGHKFYGFMDYFIAVPANTSGRGLRDLYLSGQFADLGGVALTIWLHNFWLERADEAGDRLLGQEIDVVAAYRIHDVLSLEGGLGFFNGTELMTRPFTGEDLGWWGFLGLSAAF